jgi:hypothetical protein
MLVKPGTAFYDSAPKKAPHGKLIAAYLNGRFAYTAAELEDYEAHFMISVTRDPAAAQFARCIDVERLDARPEDVPGFIHRRIHFGHHDALAYVNRANMAEVVTICNKNLLVLGHDYFLWVATLDGTKVLPLMQGVAAIQHTNTPDYDESVTILSMHFNA